MVNVRVFEAAHDLDDGVYFPDVTEELVAEAFTRAGALYETGDVHELDRGRDEDGSFGDFGERCEPGIGHSDDADVRVDGAKGIIFRRRLAGTGDSVEQS